MKAHLSDFILTLQITSPNSHILSYYRLDLQHKDFGETVQFILITTVDNQFRLYLFNHLLLLSAQTKQMYIFLFPLL